MWLWWWWWSTAEDSVVGRRAAEVACVLVSSVGVFGGVRMGETRVELRSSFSRDMPGNVMMGLKSGGERGRRKGEILISFWAF